MKLRNRRGATLVETMIIVAIVGILAFILIYWIILGVGVKRGLPWLDSQSVTDIKAIEAIEAMDYTNVRLIDSFRVNPEGDLGCAPADNAGFKMIGTDPDGQDVNLDVCCLGSPGSAPRCEIIN